MSDKHTQSVQSRTQYDGYLSELRQLVDEADQMRLALFRVLSDALRKLERSFRTYPDKKSSAYTAYYKDYWQAFDLFRERLAKTYGLFHNEHIIPNPFDQTPDERDLEEWLEEIEDTDQSYHLRRHQKQDLITAIELLDSIERLNQFKIPRPPGDRGKPFYNALADVQSAVIQIGKSIWQALNEMGVAKINLSVGEYPPPETTRILARRDDGRDDNVMIDEIIANGYFWNGKLLRKADVIVVTQQGGR